MAEMEFEYTRFFSAGGAGAPLPEQPPAVDRRDGKVYVFTREIELAVNVALVTGRPLLVRGAPGSGKSSLAPSVARRLGWRYYEEVVSSRTQARDLLWQFDTLQRLNHATLQKTSLKPDAEYVRPGALWWAFNRESARTRGGLGTTASVESHTELNDAAKPEAGAVVLLDEIDKADPDVPNDLLVPLGSLEFKVTDLGDLRVQAVRPPLVVITSNDERDLPRAFLRRCAVVDLPRPDRGRLLEIARQHFGNDPEREKLYAKLVDRLEALANEVSRDRRAPSTPELLDAIGSWLRLELPLDADSDTAKEIERLTLKKLAESRA
jgi:MoxR-like ATPase